LGWPDARADWRDFADPAGGFFSDRRSKRAIEMRLANGMVIAVSNAVEV
jgi:hypothetical protein